MLRAGMRAGPQGPGPTQKAAPRAPALSLPDVQPSAPVLLAERSDAKASARPHSCHALAARSCGLPLFSARDRFPDIGLFPDAHGDLAIAQVPFEHPLHRDAAAHGDRPNHSLILPKTSALP